jgi:hypothetical protein
VKALAAVLCLFALVACVEPTQYQGAIRIDHRGLQRRLNALCRIGAGDEVTQQACADPEPPRAAKPPRASTTGPAVAAEH